MVSPPIQQPRGLLIQGWHYSFYVDVQSMFFAMSVFFWGFQRTFTCVFGVFQQRCWQVTSTDLLRNHTNIWVCLKMLCTPLYPLVLLIIIPFLNGYFIGNIPNIFRQTHISWFLASTLRNFGVINTQPLTHRSIGALCHFFLLETWSCAGIC